MCFYHTPLYSFFSSTLTLLTSHPIIIALYGTHSNSMPPFGPAADFRAVLCAPKNLESSLND